MKFQCKNEYEAEEWWDVAGDYADAETCAEELATDAFSHGDCAPHNFEYEVHLKDEKGNVTRFSVEAEADVNFYVTEHALPQP